MLDRARATASDPRWWLWGSSREAPTITPRTIIVAAVILVIGVVLLLVALFSGSAIKRPLAAHHLRTSAPAPTAPTTQPQEGSGSSGSSFVNSPEATIIAQVAAQGAIAEVNGEWAGVPTASGTTGTSPAGQVGQPASEQSMSLTPTVQSGQVQGATGTVDITQGSVNFVVPVEIQLYNSQWLFVPQQGVVVQGSGG
jgi:hypothetical protein